MNATRSQRWASWVANQSKESHFVAATWMGWIAAGVSVALAILSALFGMFELAMMCGLFGAFHFAVGLLYFERDGFARLMEIKDAEIERLKKMPPQQEDPGTS